MPSHALCQRSVRAKGALVTGDPVASDLLLCGSEVEFARADIGVQTVFELVFDMRVPGRGLVGLRPEVSDRVGATEF